MVPRVPSIKTKMSSSIQLNLIKNWQTLINEVKFIELAPLLIQKKVVTVDEYKDILGQTRGLPVENFLLHILKKSDDVLVKFAEVLRTDDESLADILFEGCSREEDQDVTDAPDSPDNDVIPESEYNSRASVSIHDCEHSSTTTKKDRLHRTLTSNNSKRMDVGKRQIIRAAVKSEFKPKLQNTECSVSSTTDEHGQWNEEVTDEVITIIRNNFHVSKSWTTLAHALGLTERVNEIRYKVILYGEDFNMCVVYLIKDWLEMFPETAKLSNLIQVLRSEGFKNVSAKLTEILFGA